MKPLIPHGWNTAVGLAADLQLASAFPETDLVEYLIGSPFVDEIVIGGWSLDADGMLPIPDAPGLGVALDLEAVSRTAHTTALWAKERSSWSAPGRVTTA